MTIIWFLIIGMAALSLTALMFPHWIDDHLGEAYKREKALETLRQIHNRHTGVDQ